jgi:thiol-disulfide isomerase/thioredoxin
MSQFRYAFRRRSTRSTAATQARLERKCACGGHSHGAGQCDACARKAASQSSTGPAGDSVHEALRSPSHSLDTQTLEAMQSRFGHDFTGVRVHEGATAAASAHELDAQAYTVGSDLVFASGQYSPGTSSGQQLLAHELTHVIQQGAEDKAAGASIPVAETPGRELEADLASRSEHQPTAAAELGVQRQKAPAESGKAASTGGAGCIEEVTGKTPPSLAEAGAITIVDFGAEYCGPCKMLEPQLANLCSEYQRIGPGKPIRFFKIDTQAEGNEKIADQYVPDGIPQVYIYRGTQLEAHFTEYFDTIDEAIRGVVEDAARSGFMRGASKGWKWGAGIGGALGIGGAIAVGASSLSGNAKMLGILGSVVGGAAVGAGIGWLAGGIAGHLSDEKSAPNAGKKKVQAKRASGTSTDRLEREADEAAASVGTSRTPNFLRRASTSIPNTFKAWKSGQPLERPVRSYMERWFHADFGDVRVQTGSNANRVTSAMNASAVTAGPTLYFAPGEYAPSTREGKAVLAHELAHVLQTSEDDPPRALPLTRAKKTLLGLGIGAAGGAAVGALAGLGVAALSHGNVGQAAGIGALIGGGAGLIAGGLYGFFARRTSRAGVHEVEALIQRKYGKYLRGGASGPLHNSVVHPVSKAELCERFSCRHQEQSADVSSCNLIGWTDTGVPWHGGAPPSDTIATQEEEQTCHGRQMEHATADRPVIYFDRDTDDAGILIHEGLHAHSHPSYQALLNYVNEGTTEYFTRRLSEEVNIPPYSGYDEEEADVHKMVDLVGEDRFARAYFGGDLPGLSSAVNSVLGQCAMSHWAGALQTKNFDRNLPDQIMAGRGVDYCIQTASAQPAPSAAPPTEPVPV